jgi:hypothetical protein
MHHCVYSSCIFGLAAEILTVHSSPFENAKY